MTLVYICNYNFLAMNSEDFIEKLETIFSNLNVTPSMFADQIGVQRSSVSHLLSGRNKPSLDFVLKIVDTYPQIDLHWLLGQKKLKESLNLKIAPPSQPILEAPQSNLKEDKKITKEVNQKVIERKENSISKNSEVEKIVVFYRDGTFLEYAPREI